MAILSWRSERPRFIPGPLWNELLDRDLVVLDEPGDFDAVLKKTKGGSVQVQLRRNFPGGAAQLLLIVALDGWDFKHETRDRADSWRSTVTRGYEVRLSSNAACWGQVEDLVALAEAAQAAKAVLTFLEEHLGAEAVRGRQ